MANEVRLIDANAYPCQTCEVSYCYKICDKFNAWFEKTVDAVEVVHGRWVYRSDAPDEDGNLEANCSVCGAGERHNISMVGKVHFCWKCGAKMDGGNEDG